MSQGTTTHQPYDDAAYSRRAGVLVVAASAVVAVMVQSHGKNHGRAWNPGFTGALSLFGWAHWILVALLVAAGVTLARATSPTLTATAAAVGLAPAAQLVGVGIVAGRRWHPVAGMSGPGIWANQGMLEIIAGAGALAAAVALLAFVRVLGVARRAQPEPAGVSTAGRGCVVIGVLVAVSLPLLLAIGDPFAHDITSLGAVALLWSLPWGGCARADRVPRATCGDRRRADRDGQRRVGVPELCARPGRAPLGRLPRRPRVRPPRGRASRRAGQACPRLTRRTAAPVGVRAC